MGSLIEEGKIYKISNIVVLAVTDLTLNIYWSIFHLYCWRNYLSFILFDRFGRKKSTIVGLLVSCVASIVAISIPGDRSNTGKTNLNASSIRLPCTLWIKDPVPDSLDTTWTYAAQEYSLPIKFPPLTIFILFCHVIAYGTRNGKIRCCADKRMRYRVTGPLISDAFRSITFHLWDHPWWWTRLLVFQSLLCRKSYFYQVFWLCYPGCQRFSLLYYMYSNPITKKNIVSPETQGTISSQIDWLH